jgi:hypothetical protein
MTYILTAYPVISDQGFTVTMPPKTIHPWLFSAGPVHMSK